MDVTGHSRAVDVVEELERQLDSFDGQERSRALGELIRLADAGEITLPQPGSEMNLHCHTFNSYNAYGYSPSKFAWLARKQGLAVAGIVDFDGLDGLEEFYEAARRLNLKACVGMETRVFVPEFADKEINSPGEPGISYHMGVGFPGRELTGASGDFLKRLQQTAQERNRGLMERVNAYLRPVELDYERDVLKLTPGGNPTERHLCAAYARKARATFADDAGLAGFWAEKLGAEKDTVASWLPEGKDLINLIRAKTMKQGGVGYVQPGAGSFPPVAQMNEFIRAAGGIPTPTWLNGMSAGEKQTEELLEVGLSGGVGAINIIPDRNYGEGAGGEKDEKLANLQQVVKVAEKLNLPVVVGTEMNSPGQKFVDALQSKELKPLLPIFLKGAYIAYGHCVLERQGGIGYVSDWAKNSFSDGAQRNDFFEAVGKGVEPGQEERLGEFEANMSPAEMLDKIRDWNE